MPRDYKKEYASYHSKPEQKKKRAKRNAARKQAEKSGKVKKGDGKDIDHKKPLRSGGSNSKKNLRVRSKSANRADNGGKGGRPKKK
jgi:5-methylcytosine-specific restriction endonuclease McrA